MRARVLVVDDKENILKLFQLVLAGVEFEVKTADDGTRALGLLSAGEFDVVVTDIRMPGADGMTVLREAKRLQPDVEVVLMTAYGSVASAVEAMKAGAYDYLTKPFDPDEARLVVERAVERKRLREQARDLSVALEGAYRVDNLVGKSAAMQKVFGLVRRAADNDATVLVTGESGTGKELVARAVHFTGRRKAGRFVPVHCGAIPDTLLESELFGHMKGSFTGAHADKRGLFEEADGGTIFLDEVGELPLALQAKLTRVLQERAVRRVGGAEERKVDARVIAATNADLRAMVSGGKLREDLFFRLNVFPIPIPPLRERREDIPMLAALFLERHGAGRPGPPPSFTPEALGALVRHEWQGNVRELENAIERALAVSDGPRIDLEALPPEVAGDRRSPAIGDAAATLSYHEVVELARDRATREYLVALMRELGGNVTRAAERAGMERESLHRLLKRHGIHSDDFKAGT
jgi:DNA-binding NtrC family response regulator